MRRDKYDHSRQPPGRRRLCSEDLLEATGAGRQRERDRAVDVNFNLAALLECETIQNDNAAIEHEFRILYWRVRLVRQQRTLVYGNYFMGAKTVLEKLQF